MKGVGGPASEWEAVTAHIRCCERGLMVPPSTGFVTSISAVCRIQPPVQHIPFTPLLWQFKVVMSVKKCFARNLFFYSTAAYLEIQSQPKNWIKLLTIVSLKE